MDEATSPPLRPEDMQESEAHADMFPVHNIHPQYDPFAYESESSSAASRLSPETMRRIREMQRHADDRPVLADLRR